MKNNHGTSATLAVLFAVALLCCAPRGARGQAPPVADDTSAARSAEGEAQGENAAPTSGSAPTRDIADLLRAWRHKPPPPPPSADDYKKRMIAAAPVLTYGPTSGVGFGVAGNVAMYAGPPDRTRISSTVASVIATSEKQLLVNAKINGWAPENDWHLEGDNRFYWTSQKTYGLGSDSLEANAVAQKYDAFRVYDTLYRRVGSDFFVGGGVLYSIHRDVRPADDAATGDWPASPYVTYSEAYGFDPASQTSAGASVRALLDSRDSPINPDRGWYANLSYLLFFEDFLGGTSDWQQVSYDVRWYRRLSRDARHKLALWLSGDFVANGHPPYLDLPATGMDTYGRAGRGYPQGRFRGEKLVYGEVEYRWTVTRNAPTLRSDAGCRSRAGRLGVCPRGGVDGGADGAWFGRCPGADRGTSAGGGRQAGDGWSESRSAAPRSKATSKATPSTATCSSSCHRDMPPRGSAGIRSFTRGTAIRSGPSSGAARSTPVDREPEALSGHRDRRR
jgi:hypothetical protein